MTYGPGTLSREAWNPIGYDPHLERTTAQCHVPYSLQSNPTIPLDYFFVCLFVFWSDLVQRSHRDLGDIIRDELPGGALRVAGSEALSVPQVTYMKTTRIYLFLINYLQFSPRV